MRRVKDFIVLVIISTYISKGRLGGNEPTHTATALLINAVCIYEVSYGTTYGRTQYYWIPRIVPKSLFNFPIWFGVIICTLGLSRGHNQMVVCNV